MQQKQEKTYRVRWNLCLNFSFLPRPNYFLKKSIQFLSYIHIIVVGMTEKTNRMPVCVCVRVCVVGFPLSDSFARKKVANSCVMPWPIPVMSSSNTFGLSLFPPSFFLLVPCSQRTFATR